MTYAIRKLSRIEWVDYEYFWKSLILVGNSHFFYTNKAPSSSILFSDIEVETPNDFAPIPTSIYGSLWGIRTLAKFASFFKFMQKNVYIKIGCTNKALRAIPTQKKHNSGSVFAKFLSCRFLFSLQIRRIACHWYLNCGNSCFYLICVCTT